MADSLQDIIAKKLKDKASTTGGTAPVATTVSTTSLKKSSDSGDNSDRLDC